MYYDNYGDTIIYFHGFCIFIFSSTVAAAFACSLRVGDANNFSLANYRCDKGRGHDC